MSVDEQVYYHSRADFVETSDGQSNVEKELAKRSLTGHTHPATDVIEDENHRFTSDSEKATLAEQGVYTNAAKVPVAIGGVAAGTTFNEVPIQTVLTNILYPYTAPIKKITIIPNGGVYEKGAAVDITKISVDVTPKSNGIAKIELLLGSTTLTSGDMNNTLENISKVYTYQAGEARVISDNAVTLKVTEQGNKASSINSSSFTFVNPLYYGAVTAGTSITEALIKGLTKAVEEKSARMSKTFNCNNQCALFAYPASYGNLTAIYDPNGLNILPTFTKSQVTITCLDGSNVTYNVYVNGAATVSNFNISFCL